ncbi:MAG: selenite/tellurite reduction operon protein ExtJ [Desulfobulbus sp.]|jgi:ribosomal 50S subunit-recycling heat shock protein
MKKIMAVLMAAAFVFSAGTAFARSGCTVEAVEDGKVTLNCEKTDNVKVGDKVTLRVAKKLEGC